jgi:hypothetical protein
MDKSSPTQRKLRSAWLPTTATSLMANDAVSSPEGEYWLMRTRIAPRQGLSELKGVRWQRYCMEWLIMLLAAFPACAQPSSGYVYAFGGMVVVPKSAFTRWNGDFVHVGGGGEGRLTGRFALGGEVGVLKPITNQYAITSGLASVTPAFHFISKNSRSRLDPFVDGGLSLLFARGGGIAIHYGGGMNYWLRRRFGLRFEFSHHILSPEAGEAVHLVGFRAGIVFSTG